MSIKCSETVNYLISLDYYRLISKIFEDELTYIKSYKVILKEFLDKTIILQMNLGTKLDKVPEEFAKKTWINPSPLIKLTAQIPTILTKQMEQINNFLEMSELSLKNLDDHVKEQTLEIKKYQQNYENIKSNLINKYIEVEKVKPAFLTNIAKCEDIVTKYYTMKKKAEDSKLDYEKKSFNDKCKGIDEQKKIILNNATIAQNTYKNSVLKAIEAEESFLNMMNENITGIKTIVCNLSCRLLAIVLSFCSSIKDSFKVPLELVEKNLSLYNKLNQEELMNKTMEDTFNNESHLIKMIPEKYQLKIFENDKKEDNQKNKKNKKKDTKLKGFIRFEDDFEEITYFEDDVLFLIAQEMFNNFEYVDKKGLDMNKEKEKNDVKKLINKLIYNMTTKSNTDNNNYNYQPIMDEDLEILKKELTKHEIRIIFLHKLNDYRTNNLFELKEREYKILTELFTLMIDSSKSIKDFHSLELIIIFSKTYYMIEDNTKLYLFKSIKSNEYFKTKEFWVDLLIYEINKEIVKAKKEKSQEESESALKEKNDNMIFSQFLTVAENMFDFDVDFEIIKQIIEEEIKVYKLDDSMKETIYSVIEEKNKKNS